MDWVAGGGPAPCCFPRSSSLPRRLPGRPQSCQLFASKVIYAFPLDRLLPRREGLTWDVW